MKVIKLQDKFILVSDEKGMYSTPTLVHWKEENTGEIFPSAYGYKIIAGIPSLPEIDFSLLKEEDCKEIGWVDVEKLAKEFCDPDGDYDEYYGNAGFIKGFKTAQSLNDKSFSLKDMKTLFAKTLESAPTTESHTRMISDVEYRHFVMDELFNKIIQSLQQTSWEVEVNELNQIIKIL